MAKKFLILTLFIFFSISVAYSDDFFDSYVGVDNAWDGQKAITNKEFEEAIKVIEGNKKQKEEKKRKKKIKKISGGGTSLHNALDPQSEILSQDELKSTNKTEGQLLNIPVKIIVDNTVLESGFYNVYMEKDETNNIYLAFYQAHTFMGRVPAYVTDDDFDSKSINFVKLLPYNENFLKIVFGSLDVNAYVFVQYIDE